jgi:hypothetical protein
VIGKQAESGEKRRVKKGFLKRETERKYNVKK